MRPSTRFSTIVLAVALVTALSVLTLPAAPTRERVREGDGPRAMQLHPQPFTPCPVPSCMAPCRFGVPPQGECRGTDGSVAATTYFCCCCGRAIGGLIYAEILHLRHEGVGRVDRLERNAHLKA